MDDETYTAKEAMAVLKISSSTFYRRVRDGEIPYEAGRPMRFPKFAIDTLAGLEAKEDEGKNLTFELSTMNDAWQNIKKTKTANKNGNNMLFKSVAAWKYKNDEISMCVNLGTTVLGWTVFLPLKEQMILEVIKGHRKEEDIPAKAVKQWDDKYISVYIPIFEVFPTNDPIRDKRVAAFLIRNTIKWALTLKDECHIQNWYTIINSAKGQKLVTALGFQQINTLDDGERECYQLKKNAQFSELVMKFQPKK